MCDSKICARTLTLLIDHNKHQPMKQFSTKTPLLQWVAKALRTALSQAAQKDVPLESLPPASRLNRRAFIKTTGKVAILGGLAAQAGPIMAFGQSKRKPVVAIVGAGIAGLNAGWQLQKKGVLANIFEASNRVGGRMFTARNLFGEGTTTELGAEFIDTNHADMLGLVNEFGLSLRDTTLDNTLIKEAFFFNGQHYSLKQVIDELAGVAPQIQEHIDFLHTSEEQAIARFDHISLEQYLISIGATGWLNALLTQAYVTEYGLDAGVQSCLNFIGLVSADTSEGHFDTYGESDERFKIIGGNDLLTTKLAEKLTSSIENGHTLVAISQTGRRYKLTFDTAGGGTKVVVADFVVLTLPFTKQRQVAFDKNIIVAPQKRRAINELGYGTNTKLMLGFDGRPWRANGYAGFMYTDNGLQAGWENTQMQDTSKSSFTIFSGGTPGVAAGTG